MATLNLRAKEAIVLSDIEIPLSPFFAKLILRLTPMRQAFVFFARHILRMNSLHQVVVMCRGYSEDDDNFTELIWEDDKNLHFYNRDDYPEFRLWFL